MCVMLINAACYPLTEFFKFFGRNRLFFHLVLNLLDPLKQRKSLIVKISDIFNKNIYRLFIFGSLCKGSFKLFIKSLVL